MIALVTGISGQDGHYMARLLNREGYHVVGLTSDPAKVEPTRMELPGRGYEIEVFDFFAPKAIAGVIDRIRPSLIFNFAAFATGQGMFDDPPAMSRLNGTFVLDILEAVRLTDPSIRFCQASSAEMFGHVECTPQNEATPFRPRSPYGAAKTYAHNLLGVYRSAFGLRCSSAILYNHESPRRSTAFVTRKITRTAAAIKLGLEKTLALGSLDAKRDWGYAPEYVDAMYRMATAPEARDYVVATGRLNTIRDLCRISFSFLGLDYREFVRIDDSFRRSVETVDVQGDPRKIFLDLGWKAQTNIEQIVEEMVACDLAELSSVGQPRNSGISRS